MIFELDMGNTRCKWRLRNEGGIVVRDSLPISSLFHDLEAQLAVFKNEIRKVWVASVVDPMLEDTFSEWCINYLALTPEFARTAPGCRGVSNGYKEPMALGVDRWLGIIACYQLTRRACLLASFGTATTVDIVSKDGEHAGGFIAPGLNLMLDSLEDKTRRVKVNRDSICLDLMPGKTTTDAVYGAVTAMFAGLIDNGIKQLQSKAPDAGFDIIFTGGDAQKFLPFYPRAIYMPDLVLDGLAYVLDNSR
jgi:type III pantothenate kinase